MTEERIPPSFKKKTNRKKVYTKRQLEQKISAKEAEILKWKSWVVNENSSIYLKRIVGDATKRLNNQIKELKEQLSKL